LSQAKSNQIFISIKVKIIFILYIFTLQYSFKGMGRNSVLYSSAFNHLASRVKFGSVADIPINCILTSLLLKR